MRADGAERARSHNNRLDCGYPAKCITYIRVVKEYRPVAPRQDDSSEGYELLEGKGMPGAVRRFE